ncbi:MAG TPA: acetoin utilization protein AcuC [Nitrososphaera sp.]|nr:acetoin utilization protein AcuC [Nitrososphaera sp.]
MFYGEALATYGFGENHPFGNDRMNAFWKKFQSESNVVASTGEVVVEQPEIATEQDVLAFHDRDYVEFVKAASKHGGVPLDKGDTPAFKGVFEAALYAVGSTLAGLDFVIAGKDRAGNRIDHAFNPIGGLHHAMRDAASGFCVFNDIGVAIMAARSKYNIRRIAYVDIDAHHGDGVFYEFEQDLELYFADIHEDGRYLFPGTGFPAETGKGIAAGTKLNIPVQPEAGDETFITEFAKVEKFVEDANPELIIMQCGADSLAGDPITHLQYSEKAHWHAADVLHRLAHKHCHGRIIALGGGGYNRDNIGAAWTEVVKTFANDFPKKRAIH